MTKIFTLSNEWYLFGVSTGSNLYSQLLLNKESDIDFSCVVVSLGSRTNTDSTESIQNYTLSQYVEKTDYSSYVYKADDTTTYYKKNDWAYIIDWSNTTIDIPFSFGAWVLTKYLDPSVKYIPATNQDLFTYIISDISPSKINLSSITNLSSLNIIYQESSYSVKQKYENSSTWADLLIGSHNITSISKLFYNCSNFNQDITNWNTTNIENMEGLFENATSFIQNISSWDFSACINSNRLDNFNKMFLNSGISNKLIYSSNIINQNILVQYKNEIAFHITNNFRSTIISDASYSEVIANSGLNILLRRKYNLLYILYTSGTIFESIYRIINSTFYSEYTSNTPTPNSNINSLKNFLKNEFFKSDDNNYIFTVILNPDTNKGYYWYTTYIDSYLNSNRGLITLDINIQQINTPQKLTIIPTDISYIAYYYYYNNYDKITSTMELIQLNTDPSLYLENAFHILSDAIYNKISKEINTNPSFFDTYNNKTFTVIYDISDNYYKYIGFLFDNTCPTSDENLISNHLINLATASKHRDDSVLISNFNNNINQYAVISIH